MSSPPRSEPERLLPEVDGMPHYTCDRCRAVFRSADYPRYLVQLEIHCGVALIDDMSDAHDVDPLSQLHQLLTGIESRAVSIDEFNDLDDSLDDTILTDDQPDAGLPAHRAQYDLCPRCYRAFVRDPWGHDRQVPAAVNEE